LINGFIAVRRAQDIIASATLPKTDVGIAEYAAALITLRQAIPSLAPEATRNFENIKWGNVTLASTKLGSASRLAAFFKIAAGKSDVATWTRLVRTPEARGPVFVLSPADVPNQFWPGLWLDESATISGASAAQLAYSLSLAPSDPAQPWPLPDVITTALLLDHFPAEVLARFEKHPPPPDWLANSTPADRAALLITVANVLVPDCVREWFQRDPLIRTARANIPEFGEAAFGKDTSLLWRYELAGPSVEPPERRAVAVAANTPREQWPWTTITGLEFKDSPADVRPDDPMIELRFAFTWDNEALHFHAEAIDNPPGLPRPEGQREQMELLIDPKSDGFVWRGPEDFHFVFRTNGEVFDLNHQRAVPAKIERTDRGYTVDSDIPWSLLGLTPASGLELGVTTAVATDGRYEWEPSLKLNWRFFERRDERYGLGLLRLE